jgi:hypothetical protein
MSFLKSTLVAVAFVAAAAVVPLEAWAQTTSSSSSGSSTSEGITAGIPNPYRFIGSTNVTSSSRPINLNPTGANFSDCEQNLMLQFPIVASGFTGGDHIEVWAGTVDCRQDVSRTGLTSSGSQLCWQVAASTGSINNTLITSFNVYVRDVLRFENASTITTNVSDRQIYNPNWAGSDQGETACHVQSADAAVPIDIYFIPIASTSQANTGATAYKWTLNSDLVAPAAPTNVTIGIEDTALQVNWSSPGSADPDLAGFIVWSDPPAGGILGGGGCSCGSVGVGSASSYVGDGSVPEAASATTQVYECADGATFPIPSTDQESGTTAGDDSSDDGAADAGDADSSDAESGSASGDDGAGDDSADGAAGDDGAGASSDDGSSGDDSAPGTSDASDASPYPGCSLINVSIDSGAGNCYSPNLSAGFGVSGTSASTTASTGDDGSTSDDGSVGSTVATTVSSTTATASGLPGISEIPPQFNAGEIDSITTTQIALGGLTDGVNYVIVVTSIDGSGNVGPASLPACGMPAPVTDFYKTYRQANGSTPSGSCTLQRTGIPAQAPAFGVAFVGALAAWFRRRRKP